MIEDILAKWFPPKLGRIQGFEPSLTRYRIETGELQIVDPGPCESWAGNVKEYPGGLWTKGTPVRKVTSPPRRKNWTLIETF